ncbi:MAG: cytochrome c [Pirellulales bacterium]
MTSMLAARRWLAALSIVLLVAAGAMAGDRVESTTIGGFEGAGYKLLTTKAFVTPDFDQQSFDNLWQVWEEPLRSQAEKATPEERRKMAFSRYGFTTAPGDTSGKPQQYVVDAKGNWTITCLACHQGKVAGIVVPGLPNSHFAFQTLVEDVRATKMKAKKRLVPIDLAASLFPLGTSNGTTNAIMFGMALMANRDPQLNLKPGLPPAMTHHDHDAPAWWNFKKKTHLYSDGFAAKGHRPLMQFMLSPENGPEAFAAREDDFREVYAWLESLEAPKYPFAIDQTLATKGEAVFNNLCADCHGTYGAKETYPNKIVPIEEVGTDPVRLSSLTPEHRAGYGKSWFADFGEHPTVVDPGGYVAPPLDGIWASAPYFHNGSVPTLWHVLRPDQRPKVWQRTEDGYDQEKLGLEFAAFEKLPADVKTGRERRKYFDTGKFGKSAQGHTFPDALDETEKQAVLEYLKTL